MRELAGWTSLDVWHAQASLASKRERFAPVLSQVEGRRVGRTADAALFTDHIGALGRFVGLKNGEPKIVAEPPQVVPLDELAEPGMDVVDITTGLHGLLRAYRRDLEPVRRVLFDQYRFVDFARTVVGVGSVGTRSWMVLLLGDDQQDPLFLQVRETGPSVLEAFTKPSEFDNAGRRVVVGQRLMQAVSDSFLGWVRVHSGDDGRSRDFYVLEGLRRRLRSRGPRVHGRLRRSETSATTPLWWRQSSVAGFKRSTRNSVLGNLKIAVHPVWVRRLRRVRSMIAATLRQEKVHE